jgi:(1->4)-alpha-D-glucan 1-alpha-D-glucosylmutase
VNARAKVSAPSSTYRLQLNSTFTFDHAREIVDYLADLGIGACYVSPILKARAGSQHGYDVIDHSSLNPEIGSMDALQSFVERLKESGMGLILDIVPNHMCVADLSNYQWFDVLENGPSSPQARFFDIDWSPPREDLANKVLLPILGDQYGRVLENQQIRIDYVSGSFLARYYGTALPIAPRSWPRILEPAVQYVRAQLGPADQRVLELESIITALGYLPLRTETDQERIRERQREKEIIKRRLSALTSENEVVAAGITAALRAFNGIAGDASSFDGLEQLLAQQAYRLSFWRVAADEINYRRFFDINELAAVRTEDAVVFEATHRVVFDLIRRGWITGLRVDHPDGLLDPARYFADLQSGCGGPGTDAARLFVVAEKIVTRDEELRKNWAIEGTTGYGFLNQLNGLFVYPGSKNAFRSLYERWTGWSTPFAELAYDCKRLILRASMSSELNVLARRLDRICQQHRHSRDFTLESLRFALREVIACFPVYRTYIVESQSEPDAEDRRHVESAIKQAKARNPATSESVFDAIGSLLLLRDPEEITEEQRAERRLFVMRFQQLTAPVMARGIEDTAFYRYYPLASLNEVGGDPDEFGITSRMFHRKNLIRLTRWPRALLATDTHDTKRSEDVRARINVLSEIPAKWYEAVRRWNRLNHARKTRIEGVETPDRNGEYLLYQTLVGVWPFARLAARGRSADTKATQAKPSAPPLGSNDLQRQEGQHAELVRRIQDYMDKALKEAKLHTSWINPNERYDRAVRAFVASILDPDDQNAFLSDFCEFVAPVAKAGLYNSLSQLLLKIASPGIPDFYQGSESWDFSLVDPDNRRPVDFAGRRCALATIRAAPEQERLDLLADLLRYPEDGRIKLYVTSHGLRYRRRNHDLFESGSYHPIEAAGRCKRHVVAFARRQGTKVAIAAAGRFFLKMKARGGLPLGLDAWEGTALVLPKAARAPEYVDLLAGHEVRAERRGNVWTLPAGDVFRHLPVALLEARG